MEPIKEKSLEIFPTWLGSLADDIRYYLSLIEDLSLNQDFKERLISGVNYIFKSMDLIPDGIDDIGYLDDCFVIRIVAYNIVEEKKDSLTEEKYSNLKKLHQECQIIQEFLGENLWKRLSNYVAGLKDFSVRGRTPEEVLTDQNNYNQFESEVNAFINSYNKPSFERSEKTLIKFTAFMDAKLP